MCRAPIHCAGRALRIDPNSWVTNTITARLDAFIADAMERCGVPGAAVASHKVDYGGKDAGAWIFGVSWFSIIDVPSREDALEWTAKIAVACRCAQEVREIMYAPDS